jgi:hypothetical protein
MTDAGDMSPNEPQNARTHLLAVALLLIAAYTLIGCANQDGYTDEITALADGRFHYIATSCCDMPDRDRIASTSVLMPECETVWGRYRIDPHFGLTEIETVTVRNGVDPAAVGVRP